MDLSDFPKCEVAKRMLSYVTPGFYEESYVGKWIFEVMGLEMEDAQRLFEESREQIFPEIATWGLRYHEQKYSIVPLPSDSYEIRRRRILARMSMYGAMNPERLKQIVEGISGKKCEIIENFADYTFQVKLIIIGSNGEFDVKTLKEKINKIKPSHLAYQIVSERPLGAEVFVGAIMQQAEIITIRQVM